MKIAANQGSEGIRFETVLVIGLAVAAVAMFLYFASQRQQQLRASPSGFDGLTRWLVAQDISANSFTGGWTIDADTVGLNIVPLYDADLDATRTRPQSREDLLFQRDEVDQDLFFLASKLGEVPSLAILPKWRSGMRLTGIAHPALLIPPRDTQSVLADIADIDRPGVSFIRQPFSRFAYTSSEGRRLEAELYIAQVFDGRDCKPIIGTGREMVLGECPLAKPGETETVFVLSDPDLFSNHGLRLGDNARIAEDLIGDLAGGRRVIVDYSNSNWFSRTVTPQSHERTWADLKRFFGYPFTILWVSAALLLALSIWRGSLRAGPIPESRSEMSASKDAIIAARGRILRLTNQDGALLSEYVRARLTAVATELVGPSHNRHGTDEDAVLTYAGRQNPALKQALEQTLAQIRAMPRAVTAGEAIRRVDEFESILEQLANDT